MGKSNGELEDCSFEVLYKENHAHIKKLINRTRDERESIINTMSISTKNLLNDHNIDAEITGRPKHLYSIYKKITEEKIEYSQLFDLYGIRIITDNILTCYQILGLIHSKYKPIEGRIKDFIALPKSNMYQSLHTTVIGPKGHRIEIQIRTTKMHHVSEQGVAAHWAYKEDPLNQHSPVDFSWLDQIINEQKDSSDHYIENVKTNLYNDEVFVFTPKGDFLILPKGATILDAAFKVHTDIGFHLKEGIVNGKISPINYRLKKWRPN